VIVPADLVFELTRGRIEGIANCDVRVLVSVIFRAFAVDHELSARHTDSNSDLEQATLPVMLVWLFDRHVTRDDPIVEALETRGELANTSLDGFGRLHPSERDL
jgi:hypothetical protein